MTIQDTAHQAASHVLEMPMWVLLAYRSTWNPFALALGMQSDRKAFIIRYSFTAFMTSVKTRHHFFLRHRREVINIKTPRGKAGSDMRGYKPVVELRRDRQFYIKLAWRLSEN